MNDLMGFIHSRYTHFQHATTAVGSDEHQEIIQMHDADGVAACVERIVSRDPMSERAASEPQLREI